MLQLLQGSTVSRGRRVERSFERCLARSVDRSPGHALDRGLGLALDLLPGLVLAIACALALVGCGAAHPAAKSTPAAASPSIDPRAEIDALDRDIAAALSRGQLAPPPAAACSGAACATAMTTPFATPTADDAACHPAPIERCTDACTLATSICRDQDRICELARQLAGDDWAANKCTGARASCQAAHDRCCSCTA